MCSNLFETLAVHLPSFSSGNLILSKQNPQLQQYNESNNASPSLLLTVEWTTSQRDLKLDSKRKFTYAAHVVLSPSSSSAAAAATADSKEHFSPILVAGPFGQEAPPNVVWSMTNSSGRLRASFRQGVVADKDSPKKRRFIEVKMYI